MATTTSAAAVLPLADRQQFIDAVSRQCAGLEPGPGTEHRAVVAVFPTVFKPPEIPHAGGGRWSRATPSFERTSRAAAGPLIARCRADAL